MVLEVVAVLSFVGSVFTVFSTACTMFTTIGNVVGDRSTRNTGKQKKTAMDSESLKKTIKSLEKEMDEMHTEKLGLEEGMNKAMDTLRRKMLVLMLTYGMGSIILLRNYPYAGIRVLILMLVLYFYIVMVVFTPAFGRIKETIQPVQDLQLRQTKLQEEVRDSEKRLNKLSNTKNLNKQIRNQIDSLNSRIKKLQKAASEIPEISKFEDELNLLSRVAICFPIIAYFGLGLFW